MRANIRTVGKTGVNYNGNRFSAKELLEHIGVRVVVDDLGVTDTPEILVKTIAGKTICLAERANRVYFPNTLQYAGAFERALKNFSDKARHNGAANQPSGCKPGLPVFVGSPPHGAMKSVVRKFRITDLKFDRGDSNAFQDLG